MLFYSLWGWEGRVYAVILSLVAVDTLQEAVEDMHHTISLFQLSYMAWDAEKPLIGVGFLKKSIF